MNAATSIPLPFTLDRARRHVRGTVAAVDWHMLSDAESRRLREFGLDDGVDIELLHGSAFGSGPIAARIGRMTITFRAHVARAIHVIR